MQDLQNSEDAQSEQEKEEDKNEEENTNINNRFDMNIPVHDKMMELYFKADEYIEEAS